MPELSDVYRKAALERLTSSDELDQLLELTPPREWLALGSIGVALAGALLWGVLGSVSHRVSGEGFLAPGRGAVLFLPAAEAGAVRPGMTARVIRDRAGTGARTGRVVRVGGPTDARGVPVEIALDAGPAAPAGAPAAGSVVVRRTRPLELLLPRLGAGEER